MNGGGIEQVITVALKMYQNQESLSMLLEAICTLVEQMREEVDKPEILSVLIPPIIEKWSSLKLTTSSLKSLTRKDAEWSLKQWLIY